MADLFITDTHCHLFHDENNLAINSRLENEVVNEIFVPSVDFKDCSASIQYLTSLKSTKIGLGYHPMNALSFKEELESFSMDKYSEVEFIGEIGLDKRYLKTISFEAQKEVLIYMLNLASKYKLWVNIHCVGMHYQLIAILKAQAKMDRGVIGIIHSFSASYDIAMEYIKLGFILGIGPAILNPNFKTLEATVKRLPVEKIVVETDYPYTKKFTDNMEALFLPNDILLILSKIAELKNISYQEIMEIVNNNRNLLVNHK